jgi:hypothetical protein
MHAMPWYAGLAGPQDGYGREIGRLEAWDGGYTDPDYIAASATRSGPSLARARTNCSTLSRPISCARCSTESLPPRLLRGKNSYPNDFMSLPNRGKIRSAGFHHRIWNGGRSYEVPCVKRPVWVLVEQCLYDAMIAGAVRDVVLPAVPDDADRGVGDGRGVGMVESSRSGAVLQVGAPCASATHPTSPTQGWCTNE